MLPFPPTVSHRCNLAFHLAVYSRLSRPPTLCLSIDSGDFVMTRESGDRDPFLLGCKKVFPDGSKWFDVRLALAVCSLVPGYFRAYGLRAQASQVRRFFHKSCILIVDGSASQDTPSLPSRPVFSIGLYFQFGHREH